VELLITDKAAVETEMWFASRPTISMLVLRMAPVIKVAIIAGVVFFIIILFFIFDRLLDLAVFCLMSSFYADRL
jgi:hypothetical protein